MTTVSLPDGKPAVCRLHRRHILRVLAAIRTWLTGRKGKTQTEADQWRAENILIGCAQILKQCGADFGGWLDRTRRKRRSRRRLLRHVRTNFNRGDGLKVLLELIDFTESALQAAVWLDTLWVGALPILVKPVVVTEAQRAALCKARQTKRARRQQEQEQRERRLEMGFPQPEPKDTDPLAEAVLRPL